MIKTEVTGKARIYRKEYNGRVFFETQLSKKDKDGEWMNGYIGIQFKKGVDVPDKTDIEITKAWIDFYVKDKKTVPFIFCLEFEADDLPSKNNKAPDLPEGFAMLTDDESDIPF